MARKVYGIGETVLDIIFKNDKPVASKPGGSTFNALISLGRLHMPVSFISDLGADKVGDNIIRFLKDNHVDTAYVNRLEGVKSAIALAFLNDKNDAEYSFYKDYSKQNPIPVLPDFKQDDILLFGSFYGINPRIRPIIQTILQHAVNNKVIIYYDPNYRSSHLDKLDNVKSVLEENFSIATLLRGSDEDFMNIYGAKTSHDIYKKIQSFNPRLIITRNKDGVDLCTNNGILHVDTPEINPVSTIGAGDSFNAGIIYGLLKYNVTYEALNNINDDVWKRLFEIAIQFSSEVCMSYDNYISKDFAQNLIT